MSPGKRPKKSRKSPILGKFIMLNASWLLSGNRRQRRPKTANAAPARENSQQELAYSPPPRSSASVKDKKDEFLHQFTHRSGWIIQSLYLRIHLLKLLNNRHHFHARIVPHSCNIFARRPSSAQIQEFCELIFVLPVGCIISNHQVLEISKEHREKREERTTLRIVVKIIYYLICLEHITADDGTSQLEGIEVFAHPYFSLHNLRSNTPVILRKRNEQLVELGSESVQICST